LREPGAFQDDVYGGSLQYQKGDSLAVKTSDLQCDGWRPELDAPTSERFSLDGFYFKFFLSLMGANPVASEGLVR